MKFPHGKYEELPTKRSNTLQVFITNRCNLKCSGCFVRKMLGEEKKDITFEEYMTAVLTGKKKGAEKIVLIGGEPMLHPLLKDFVDFNTANGLKTTIYSNGVNLNKTQDLSEAKVRISLYCKSGKSKSTDVLPKTDNPYEVCFMVSRTTTLEELIETANIVEARGVKIFFISSLRELDNPRQEFYDDTDLTMPLIAYKELVHQFLVAYDGDMEIHVSKRGVFESNVNLTGNRCKFANYFIGGKIIQCPYDIVNDKCQSDYEYDVRYCQQNSSCLMTKLIFKKKQ